MPHATATNSSEEPIPREADVSPRTIPQDFYDATENHNPKDVQAQLHYLSSLVEYTKAKPPVQVVTRSATYSDPRTTVKLAQGPPETIRDIRGKEDEFTLAKNGFQFVKYKSQFVDWEYRDRIWTEYVEKETRELVAKVVGGVDGDVDEVIAFHEGVSPFLESA